MKTELIIANKSSGKIWECSNSVTAVSWATERTGSPGKLTFTIIKSGDLSFTEGDVVRFSVDGQLQFYGWVFTKSKDRWGVIEVTCLDRLRYPYQLSETAAGAYRAFLAGQTGRVLARLLKSEDLEGIQALASLEVMDAAAFAEGAALAARADNAAAAALLADAEHRLRAAQPSPRHKRYDFDF